MEQEHFMAVLTFRLYFVSLWEEPSYYVHEAVVQLYSCLVLMHFTVGYHVLTQHLIEESEN